MTRKGKHDMSVAVAFPRRPIFEGRRKSRQDYAFEFPATGDKFQGRRIEVVARVGSNTPGPIGIMRSGSNHRNPNTFGMGVSGFEDQRWERRRDGGHHIREEKSPLQIEQQQHQSQRLPLHHFQRQQHHHQQHQQSPQQYQQQHQQQQHQRQQHRPPPSQKQQQQHHQPYHHRHQHQHQHQHQQQRPPLDLSIKTTNWNNHEQQQQQHHNIQADREERHISPLNHNNRIQIPPTRSADSQRFPGPQINTTTSPVVDTGAFPPRVESRHSPHQIPATFTQLPPITIRTKWEDQDFYIPSSRQLSPQMTQTSSPEAHKGEGSEDRNGESFQNNNSSSREIGPGRLYRRATEESIGSTKYESGDTNANNTHKRVPSRSGSNAYQNASPKGLRVRTQGNSRQQPSRGRTIPDPNEPNQNGHRRKESNGSAPIIQMPLAFSSIAKTRTVNAITTPSISLPDLKAHTSRPTGRRPSILKDEVQKQPSDSSNSTHRNYSPNLGELQHIQNYYSRQHTPSPPPSHTRSRERTPSPSSLADSPNEVKSSFRTALQNSRLHRYQNEHSEEQRSSVVTSDTALTSSTLEAGEMSVEDAIGMYESDEEDHDPTQNPVIDPQQRTGSGTPVHLRSRSYDMERKRSPSRVAEYKADEPYDMELQNMTDMGFEISPVRLISNTELLEAELQEAQNTPQVNVPTEERVSELSPRLSIVEPNVSTLITNTNPQLNGLASPQDPCSTPDLPPKNPPTDPSGLEPRDRYGFRKKSQFVTLPEYEAWSKGYEETLARRQKKWQALLKESGLQPSTDGPTRFPPRSQKVKRFVRKGIPPEWRGAAWFWYAGGRTHLSKHPGLYDKLVNTPPPADSEAPELIERDLHRTFPDNIHFKPEQNPLQGNKRHSKRQSSIKIPETPMVKSLRRVLLAFALYVPRIGYCQSLNFWAGMLLLFMEEEKAFWMLYIITHQYLPGTHDTSLEGSNIDQGVLMMSVRESVPQVWQKISMGLDGSPITLTNTKLPDITLCTASWLMSGFISNLPVETVLRVWDSFFYEGSKILFRISLALFKAAEVPIRNLTDPIDVFQVIQTTPRKFIDAGALMDLCFKRRNGYGHLSQQQIDDRRKERRAIIEREARKRTEQNGDVEAMPRGSKDDMVLRKMFMGAGGLDDATSRFKKYYKKK